MVSASSAEQFELIEDDPRVDEREKGPIQLLRAWKQAYSDHPGGLIARPLAAEILGISTAHVASLCVRGRLSDVSVGPCKLVSAAEVEALWEERKRDGLSVGGRGHKLPSMADVIRLSSKVFSD